MEDDAIVALYWQRNEEALRLSEEKYGSRLRGLALRILADAHDAEECENDTYLAAWNSIPPHEPRSYLFAFLARITRHLSLDRCRSRNREKRGGGAVAALTEELLQFYARCYTQDPTDPLCSPLLGDLTGFPPTLIFAGGDEIMLDDATMLHQRLLAAGCGCTGGELTCLRRREE